MAFPNPPRTWTDGELITAAIMNPHIRDALNALGPHLIVRKPSDESVTSNSTPQPDNDLILPVAANEVWRFEFHLLVTASAAGDFKLQFTFPSGGTFAASLVGINTSGTVGDFQLGDNSSPTLAISVGITSATVPDYLRIEGTYVNGGTAGNVGLEWAQAGSDAGATIVKTNSTLWGAKLA